MNSEMQIFTKAIDEVRPYENNPRNNDGAVDAVAESIKEFGWKQPIVIDGEGTIVAGHTRFKAAKKLGLAEVPCVSAADLTEEQVKAYRLADNKTAELAGWEFDVLSAELAEIQEINMAAFGFEPNADTNELEAVEDNYTEPDELPEIAKSGGCYALGNHRLIVGDSTKEETLAQLCEKQADLLITDPPYNVALGTELNGRPMRPSEAKQLHRRTDGLIIQNDHMEKDDFTAFLIKAFSAAEQKMKPGAAFYIWHAHTESLYFFTAAKESGLTVKQALIWAKSVFALGRQDYQWQHEPCLYGWKEGAAHYFVDDRKQTTVIDDSRPDIKKMTKAEMQALLEEIYSDKESTTILHEKKPTRSELHPTMKPIPLIARLIKNSSRQGDVVLDPFGGSGTTLIACEQLGRSCRMVELDEHYSNAIIDRWQKFTGEKAKLINGN